MEKTTVRRGLSGTALKVIALVCMLLDHIHYFFGFTGRIPEAFSMAGRISAPLFLFCLAEGFAHTRDRRRYFLRIYLIGAAMSALLFFMRFAHVLVRPDGFYPQNGMMTTFTLLIVIWQGIDWLRERRFVRGTLAVGLPILWPIAVTALLNSCPSPAFNAALSFLCASVLPLWGWLSPDTMLPFIVVGVVLYSLRGRRAVQAAAFVCLTMLFDFARVYRMASALDGFAPIQMLTTYYEWLGVLAAPLMLCYNGTRGRGMKRLFYAFYPAHIYALYALSWGLYALTH